MVQNKLLRIYLAIRIFLNLMVNVFEVYTKNASCNIKILIFINHLFQKY